MTLGPGRHPPIRTFSPERYPRSATKAVTSFVRGGHTPSYLRERFSPSGATGPSGGWDSCPFPSHAGNLTRMIADLLCLPPSAPTINATPEEGKDDGSESRDVCALRLARLQAWKLLDSPHAFQEVFSCAALLMESHSHHTLRVSCEWPL